MSRSTYALTWVAEGVGDQPQALFAFPDTASSDARVAATRRAADELEHAGLYDRRHGQLHPDLLAAYRLLARPEVEFSGDVATAERPLFTALVAAADGHGVLATLDAERFALYPVRPDGVAEALVGVLPSVPSAHGQSATAPASAVDSPGGRHAPDGEEFSVFAGQGRPDPAVTRLRKLASQPRTGAAQFRVAVRDQLGRRWPGEFALNVIDVESGRWVIDRQRNAGGDVWITAAPATPETLAAKLYQTCRALRAVR
jgi:ESX secretion-associated protein EspG